MGYGEKIRKSSAVSGYVQNVSERFFTGLS
jgi:hypothetical protein